MPEARGPQRMEVELQYGVGALQLDVAFVLGPGWTILFAPSGAGKSTVLRLMAGLVSPDRGRVVGIDADGTRTVLTDTSHGTAVPAWRRGIGMVAQEPALFPHLSVLENVRYGVRGAGRRDTEAAMEVCRVTDLGAKMPGSISGGERQRVALARAIAARPGRLLLLDEPFSGLDVAMREEVAGELRSLLAERDVPVLQVTHDLGDVLASGGEVLLLQSGRIVAKGSAEVVLAEEIGHLRRQLGGI